MATYGSLVVTERAAVRWGPGGSPETVDAVAARWRGTFEPSHLAWSVTIEGDRARSAGSHGCVARQLDDVTVVDCICDPCTGVRTDDEVNATDGEFAVLVLVASGRESLQQGGEHLEIGSGDVVMWDSRLPARFRIHERLQKTSLIVPQTVLDAPARRLRRGAVRLDHSAAATHLLRRYVEVLGTTGGDLDGPSAVAARNAGVELLLAALRAGGAPASALAYEVLRDQMMRYIDEHLGAIKITPEELAAAHCVSERTVHRVFHETGETVGDVVRRQRLARARHDVINTEVTLSTIAHRWRYADLSHFTRSFKARYGHPPSHLRSPRD